MLSSLGLGFLFPILLASAHQLQDEDFGVEMPERTTTRPWSNNGKINQFKGFVTPQPPGIYPSNSNFMFASVWATWSAWSFCVNGMRMRVRACNTVRGFSCLGSNKEVQPCDAFDPGITTQRRRIESDYDVVDPWESDRREAMKQLYTDPESPEDEPMPPPPQPPRNDDNFATLNNNGLAKRHRAAGVKTIISGVPLAEDPEKLLARQQLLAEAEMAKIGSNGLRRPTIGDIENAHPPGIPVETKKEEEMKERVKPSIETATEAVLEQMKESETPTTQKIQIRNSGRSFLDASLRNQPATTTTKTPTITTVGYHYSPPVTVLPKPRHDSAIAMPTPIPVQPIIRVPQASTEFSSLSSEGSEEAKEEEEGEEGEEEGDGEEQDEIPELPNGLEEEFPTGFTPQDVQNFFNDEQVPHFDPLPTRSPQIQKNQNNEAERETSNKGQPWSHQTGDSNHKKTKEEMGKKALESQSRILTKEELLENPPVEELVESLITEKNQFEMKETEKESVEAELIDREQPEIPLASIFSEKSSQETPGEPMIRPEVELEVNLPEVRNPQPLTPLIKGEIEVVKHHPLVESTIVLHQNGFQQKEETQPLNSNNPLFANNKVDRFSLHENPIKEAEQMTMGSVDEGSVQPRSAPQPPPQFRQDETQSYQSISPQTRAQGWQKSFELLKKPARPTLQDVFPQQRDEENDDQQPTSSHPMPPKPRLESRGEISADTAKALDWMLNNITKAAEDGDRKFFARQVNQQQLSPPGYSPMLEPYSFMPNQQNPQLPAGTAHVVHGISKKKPVGAASYAHRRKNVGWTHKSHSGDATPRPPRPMTRHGKPPGLSRRKAWHGLSKPKYPKVDGGEENNMVDQVGNIRDQIQKATFTRQKPQSKGFFGYDGFNFERPRVHAAPNVDQSSQDADKDGLVGEIEALEKLMKNIESELKVVDDKKHKAAAAIQDFRRDQIESIPLENDGLHSEFSLVKMSNQQSTTSTQKPNAMDLELAPKVGFQVQRERSIGIIPSRNPNEPVFFTDSVMTIGNSAAKWGPWSTWGGCFCGNQVRTRACDYMVGFTTTGCEGSSYEARPCIGGTCPFKPNPPSSSSQIKFKVKKRVPKLNESTKTPPLMGQYFSLKPLSSAGIDDL